MRRAYKGSRTASMRSGTLLSPLIRPSIILPCRPSRIFEDFNHYTKMVFWSASEAKTTGSPATTSKTFHMHVKSYNLITDLLASKSPTQFKVNFPNMSSYSTLPEGLPEGTERLGTPAARAWLTCPWHQKTGCPIESLLWSMSLIQRWFSNKIGLDYCKHKSNPRGRRSSNPILGNAVWSKINLVAVLFPETWSCVFSFFHTHWYKGREIISTQPLRCDQRM